MRLLRTHAEVGVGQSGTEVPAQATPALTAQHVRGRGAAERLKSLPTHLHTVTSFYYIHIKRQGLPNFVAFD